MTERAQPTVDPTRIPPTPPGVPSYRDEIASAATAIAERFDPDRVVLFGSRASGTPRPDSDIDLMVIMDTPLSLFEQTIRIHRTLGMEPRPRFQILIRRPDDIALRLEEGDFFIEDVVLGGITLYARDGMDDPPANGKGHAPRLGTAGKLTTATLDWLRKADDDEGAARHLLTAPTPRPNLICFLAQQSAEKNFKGFLQQHDIRFPRTHDLIALAALAAPLLPGLAAHSEALVALNLCAVDPRYPGIDVTPDQADAALRTMATVRELVSAALESSEGTQA